jgi:hypothetical protein
LPQKGWPKAYSWTETCWSESRQALIFKRRHTQHNSSSGLCGVVEGAHADPHTAHFFSGAGRTGSIDFFAIAMI